jgi:hypothetical protein
MFSIPPCFLPGTTITLQVVHNVYCSPRVSSRALPLHCRFCIMFTRPHVSSRVLPLHCRLCIMYTVPPVFLPRDFHYTLGCVVCSLYPLCFLPSTTNTLQAMHNVYYTPCVSSQALPYHCRLCIMFTIPSVFLPRHYQYTAGGA